MSSFIINKEEYIKVGGFFSGLALTATNKCATPLIYWYSPSKHRSLGSEDYYDAFSLLYEYNRVSVNRQYHEYTESENIPEDELKDLFAEYQGKARRLWFKADYQFDPLPLKNAINKFNKFCHCVNYQIEDEELNAQANKFLNKCRSYLLEIYMEYDHLDEPDGWSNFDITLNGV